MGGNVKRLFLTGRISRIVRMSCWVVLLITEQCLRKFDAGSGEENVILPNICLTPPPTPPPPPHTHTHTPLLQYKSLKPLSTIVCLNGDLMKNCETFPFSTPPSVSPSDGHRNLKHFHFSISPPPPPPLQYFWIEVITFYVPHIYSHLLQRR